MVHRLFHSLVVSSVLALGGGCASTHDPADPPPPPPDPDSDAGALDAGAPDAGMPDAGQPDAGPEDLRACEDGWPTTKGFFCTSVSLDRVECCSSFDETDCCVTTEGP